MNEEDKELLYINLIEVRELLYVLEVALDNDMQETKTQYLLHRLLS